MRERKEGRKEGWENVGCGGWVANRCPPHNQPLKAVKSFEEMHGECGPQWAGGAVCRAVPKSLIATLRPVF